MLAAAGCALYAISREFTPAEIKESITEADAVYIAFGVIIVPVFFICEGINIGRGLEISGYEIPFVQKMRYSLAGFFFSSITPSASGGQPAQIYMMHKDGIKVQHGAVALILELISFQTALVLISGISFLLLRDRIPDVSRVMFAAGETINIAALLILDVMVFSEKGYRMLSGVCIRFFKGHRIRILRWAVQYKKAADKVKGKRKVMIPMIFTSLVQLSALFSATYAVCPALGIKGENVLSVAGLQSILHASVSALPFPGGAGVTEGGFVVIFSDVFKGADIAAAVVLSRIISFLIPLIISGILLAADNIRYRRKQVV